MPSTAKSKNTKIQKYAKELELFADFQLTVLDISRRNRKAGTGLGSGWTENSFLVTAEERLAPLKLNPVLTLNLANVLIDDNERLYKS